MRMLPDKIANHVVRFRRYYKRSPKPKSELTSPGPMDALGKFLDKRLTADPKTGNLIDQRTERLRNEFDAKLKREWAQSLVEFKDDPPELVKAWLERFREEHKWLNAPEFRRARASSLTASFVSIIISWGGLYPTKVGVLGIDFTNPSKFGFCCSLLILTWFFSLSLNMIVRDALIDAKIISLEHHVSGKYKEYDNNWTRYIFAWQAEKNAFSRRLPNWLAVLATASLFCSILHWI